MSEPDPMAQIWACADAQQARFSGDEVAAWPEGHADMLAAAGVLRRDDNATSVVCEACPEGHVEKVAFIESPPGSPIRSYIHCPEAGRVNVPMDRLKQWVVDFHGLARAAAKGLDLAGRLKKSCEHASGSWARRPLAAGRGRSSSPEASRGSMRPASSGHASG